MTVPFVAVAVLGVVMLSMVVVMSVSAVVVVGLLTVVAGPPVAVMVVGSGSWLGQPHQGEDDHCRDVEGAGVVEQVVRVNSVQIAGNDGRSGAEGKA